MSATSKSSPDPRKAKPRPPRKGAPGVRPNSAPETGTPPREQVGTAHEPAQREALLRAIFETEPECVKVLDQQGNLVEMNRAGLDMIEADSLEQVRGECVFSLVTAEHRTRFRRLTEQVFRGESGTLEFEVVGLKGTHRWLETRAVPLRDESGAVTRLLGITRDISERKRVERMQSALYRISEEARSAEDLQKFYASIHDILSQLMYAKNCYIALHDPASGVVSFPYFVDEREAAPAPRKSGRGLTEYVLRTGRPLLAVPEMLEELVQKGEVQRIGVPSLDWMGVPLKKGETTFGALVLQTYEEKPRYGEKEKEILLFVSQQIATAIEQKRREQALRESENKFRAVSETTSGGIFIRQGSRFCYVNSAAEQLTGYSREELLAMDHEQIVHPDFRPLLQERSQARLRGEPVPARYEAKLLSKSGQERWAELTATVIEFEGKPAVLTTTFDITDRKRAEQELAESEAKFRAVAETAAAAIYIHDGAKFLFVNRTAEVISGYSREELMAKGPFDLVHPEHRAMTQQRGEARTRGEHPPTRYEFKILTKSGETRWLDFSASVVQFEGRNCVLSMAFDITERKRAEALQGALYRIAEKARSAEALPQLYASIHAILGELMYAKNCYIALYDPATDMVSFPYFVDEKDPPFPPHKFGSGLTEYILRTGQPLLATLEKLDELTRQGEVRRMGAASLDWMGVPLKKGGHTFGALVLQSYQPNVQYGEKEKEILTFVSQQIASAIEGKRSEEALRESESKFRGVAEGATVAIGIYDGSHFLYVNPTFEGLTGYSWEELRSMDQWALVHPDHRPALQERLRARLRGESAVSRYEFPIRTKSGEERWLDFSAGAIEFSGRPAVLGSAVDITDRKRAEALQSALYRISEQATAAEDLPQLFASLHAIVGELMYARNFYIALYDAAAGILSFPYFVDEEDVTPAPKKLGKALTEYVLRHGEPLLASPEVFDDLVRRGEVETVGAPSVDWLGVPLKSGDTTFGVLVVQSYSENVRFNEKQKDILTFVSQHVAAAIERKRAQEALRESEARYRKQVQGAVYGIYRSNVADRFLEVNPALVAMLGYNSAEELLALNLARDVYADPKERGRLIQSYRHSERVENVETRWKKKDGTPIEVRLSGRAVLDEKGEAEGFEMIAEDITERRNLEQQLRQSQKMEAVGRLAGGVAHDFNNLLTVIKGYSELMLEQTIPGGPLRAEVEEVKNAADRAASLTRQLLAFSRQQLLAPKILDLNAAVRNMEQMLRRLLGEDIELSTVLGEKLGQVKADPGQIEQVIMNLSVNSRDAMSRGGKLTIETANAVLDESYMREHGGVKPGRYVMLAVSDTGAGMDEETRSRVFEPFFTTKEMGKGTGLGLSTVYGIVKQSEGYIWVYSEAGLGTSFKVYLPRVDESAEDSQKMAALGTGDRGSETILLVEDEDGVRALVKQVLSRQGYTVIETRHGPEALAESERHSGPIPLLLTDVVLPQMSGRELAERLKVLRPDIRVLYMSGYTDDAILRHGVIGQETAFLQKPFTTASLTRKVREVLDQQA
jgi:PAS domain S-box-containing protein